LRNISYNIRNGNGMDDVNNLERVAAVICAEKADFIAIQEVDSMTTRSGSKYVLGDLAKMTGTHATYAPAIDYDGGKYGIGLLSQTEPLGHKTYALPGREEKRVLLVTEFEKLYVCTAHFSLTEQDRIASAKIVLDILKALDKPLLFAGDLNALPESKEMVMLNSELESVVFGEKTWQSDSPTEAIDYIFGIGVEPLESRVIEETTASDHRPILAKVKLK